MPDFGNAKLTVKRREKYERDTEPLAPVAPVVPLVTVPAGELRTPKSLASSYGLGLRTLTKAIERKRLPAIRVGFQWYTTEAEFLRWLESGENRAGPVPKIKNPDPEVAGKIPGFLLLDAEAA